MKKQGLCGVMALLAALSCDNGTDLASDESGGGTQAFAGGTKANGGTSAGKDGGGEQSRSGSAGLAGGQVGGSGGHGGSSGHGGASAGAGGGGGEAPPCPTDLGSAHGQDCSAYDEGTECSDGQTDPCQFGNSIICTSGKWQRRESFPAPCGGAGGGSSSDGMLGDVCEPIENSCGQGLACCYPCGVEGCDFVCEARCAAGSAGCIDGCVAKP